MRIVEFSAEPLSDPITCQIVEEGHYATAEFSPETTHLATFGLMTCKAVGLYNPETQYGLLAHIDGTAHPERILGTVIDRYEAPVSDAEVRIVQAVQDEFEMLWPSTDMIAGILMEYGPRSLRVDRNAQNRWRRDIALCLKTGLVYETGHNNETIEQPATNLRQSTPLRGSDFHL